MAALHRKLVAEAEDVVGSALQIASDELLKVSPLQSKKEDVYLDLNQNFGRSPLLTAIKPKFWAYY